MPSSEFTSLGIKRPTKERFEAAKPYGSISHDEFVSELLDRYEGADE